MAMWQPPPGVVLENPLTTDSVLNSYRGFKSKLFNSAMVAFALGRGKLYDGAWAGHYGAGNAAH
jgi:hypothetical protein